MKDLKDLRLNNLLDTLDVMIAHHPVTTTMDHVLDDDKANAIEQLFLFTDDFPWFLVHGVDKEYDGNYMMVHDIFYDGQWRSSDGVKDACLDIMAELQLKSKQYELIYRIKANLLLPTKEIVEFNNHVDMDYIEGAKTAVYYVNDNNGYTTVEMPADNVVKESKKNSALIMDQDMLHRGSTSTDQPRVVINFNFMPQGGVYWETH